MFRLRHLWTVLAFFYRILQSLIGVVGVVLRPALRFVGGLLLLAGVIALASDLTRWQIGIEGPLFETLAQHFKAYAPATMENFGLAIGRSFHPLVWDPVLLSILTQPAWILFAVIGLALAYAGRERQKVSIFIN